jgi:hypothetical protein
MMEFENVLELIKKKKDGLSFDEEDAKLIEKLWKGYYKKQKGIYRSKPEILGASVMWLYSKINFLWENDKRWSKNSLSKLFKAKSSTVGNKASEMHKRLSIRLWDERFCKKEVANTNPLKKLVITQHGLILPRDLVKGKGIPFKPIV